jgi:hypothetical protein
MNNLLLKALKVNNKKSLKYARHGMTVSPDY